MTTGNTGYKVKGIKKDFRYALQVYGQVKGTKHKSRNGGSSDYFRNTT